MTLKDLLEQVRIYGRIKVKKGMPIDASMPIELTSDSGNVRYMNSGGRNIIFDFNGQSYKLKGVDPHGFLTKKVSSSKKNKLVDVAVFDNLERLRKESGLAIPPFRMDKPFGVLLKEDAEREKEAFNILGEKYREFGIESPCSYHGTYGFENGYVQNLYEMPSLDSDLRLEEFDQLLRDRLNMASKSGLERKAKSIMKLYSRFIKWVGWNIGLTVRCGLHPTPQSWMPQNFVISRAGDGYGLFRVDHTSTVRETEKDQRILVKKILSESGMGSLEQPTFGAYTHIPTSILIALNYKFCTGAEPRRNEPLFEQGYDYVGMLNSWKFGYGHFMKVFGASFVFGLSLYGKPEPIERSRIREALA